jgi:hypothetical protein
VKVHGVEPTLSLKQLIVPNDLKKPVLAKMALHGFVGLVHDAVGASKLYLLFDQFENFFTRLQDTQLQNQFIESLATCLNDQSLANVRWVIALRREFFGSLESFRAYDIKPFESSYLLKRFTREEAVLAIRAPARQHNTTISKTLATRIIDDLAHQYADSIELPPGDEPEIALVAARVDQFAGQAHPAHSYHAATTGAATTWPTI